MQTFINEDHDKTWQQFHYLCHNDSRRGYEQIVLSSGGSHSKSEGSVLDGQSHQRSVFKGLFCPIPHLIQSWHSFTIKAYVIGWHRVTVLHVYGHKFSIIWFINWLIIWFIACIHFFNYFWIKTIASIWEMTCILSEMNQNLCQKITQLILHL